MAEAELSILLRLKDEATSALKSVQSNIKDFEKSFKSIGIAAGVAGAAITGFAVLAIKSFADTGEELNRLNVMTGISVETLSVLKYMAESTGGSLSDIQTAFRGMANFIELASEKQEQATKTLKALGLSYDDLRTSNPEGQFMMLAFALAGVEDATKRAAMAQDLFGRSGMALIPIFAQGDEGIKQMVDDAHRLGVVFDTDLTQKSLAVHKSMQDMKFGMQGLQIAIATALSPAIVNLVTNVINLLTGFAQFVRDHPGVVQAIAAIGVALTILAGTLIAAATAMAILQALSGPVGWAALAAGAAVAAGAVAGIYYLTRTPEIPAMQSGGIVTRPTLAMIGEGGAEAVIPLSGGQGGMGMNVTVNVGGSVISDRDLVAFIRSELLMIKDRNYSTGI